MRWATSIIVSTISGAAWIKGSSWCRFRVARNAMYLTSSYHHVDLALCWWRKRHAKKSVVTYDPPSARILTPTPTGSPFLKRPLQFSRRNQCRSRRKQAVPANMTHPGLLQPAFHRGEGIAGASDGSYCQCHELHHQ